MPTINPRPPRKPRTKVTVPAVDMTGILERDAFDRRTVPDSVIREVEVGLWRRWLA